jgi:hypothetical protein
MAIWNKLLGHRIKYEYDENSNRIKTFIRDQLDWWCESVIIDSHVVKNDRNNEKQFYWFNTQQDFENAYSRREIEQRIIA